MGFGPQFRNHGNEPGRYRRGNEPGHEAKMTATKVVGLLQFPDFHQAKSVLKVSYSEGPGKLSSSIIDLRRMP